MNNINLQEQESSNIFHPNTVIQMEFIEQLLGEAGGLGVEIITSALIAMQSDPTLEPYEAFAEGFAEWIK